VRFRTKIFLAVLVPACALVAAAAAAAVGGIRWRSERDAREELRRTRSAVEHVLAQTLEKLKSLSKPLSNPRFGAAIRAALEGGDKDLLTKQIEAQLESLHMSPDLLEVRGPEGQLLLRQSSTHARCPPGCAHPLPGWALETPTALTEIDGEPYAAQVVVHDDGLLVFGIRLEKDLRKLVGDFAVQVILRSGENTVYASLKEWRPEAGRSDDVYVAGRRYLAISGTYSTLSSVILLRSMDAADRDKRVTLAVAGGALLAAVLAATLVSLKISRGVSRPVEALVGAARQVGEGDFTVKVAIPGRDEMARLGDAFNEMTGGLLKRQEIMEKTLSRDVAEELLKGVELGGDRRELTVLFMDIRGFTSATEGMDPAEVVAMLNGMMDRLAEAVHGNGGIVNKYLGDGLMAVFGAPKPLERHALAAVRAGLEMQRRMDAWNAERLERDLPTLQIGIGINTGIAVGGKVGSRRRLEYTVIGEEVNLASRVCGKAAPGQVLITGKTCRQVRDQAKVRELEPVEVKGLSYAVQVFEVLE
jgi:class 3 adenylate cyclase